MKSEKISVDGCALNFFVVIKNFTLFKTSDDCSSFFLKIERF